MRHLDLCSGIGGFALAARWAGFETVAFCEIDAFCRKVLAKHWPGVPVERDLIKLAERLQNPYKLWRFKQLYGTIDLLTAGIPCQPYSLAGERRGAADDRALWPQTLRIIRAIKPRWVVIENVAGFVSLALDGVLSELESEGYETQAFIIPAVAVDAQHRRDRVWIVAHASSDGQELAGPQCELQQSAQSGGAGVGITSDPTGQRRQIPFIRRQSAVEQSASHGAARGVATDPHGSRQSQPQRSEREEWGWVGDSRQGAAGHTNGAGCEKLNAPTEPGREGLSAWGFNSCRPRQSEIESGVCRADDGIPSGMDRTIELSAPPTIPMDPCPKNYQARLRGCGNAVHTGVVYEIFEVIKAVEARLLHEQTGGGIAC